MNGISTLPQLVGLFSLLLRLLQVSPHLSMLFLRLSLLSIQFLLYQLGSINRFKLRLARLLYLPVKSYHSPGHVVDVQADSLVDTRAQ